MTEGLTLHAKANLPENLPEGLAELRERVKAARAREAAIRTKLQTGLSWEAVRKESRDQVRASAAQEVPELAGLEEEIRQWHIMAIVDAHDAVNPDGTPVSPKTRKQLVAEAKARAGEDRVVLPAHEEEDILEKAWQEKHQTVSATAAAVRLGVEDATN